MPTKKTRSRAGKHQIPAIRLADPFYEREIERYESPLPSREYILQLLTEAGCPVEADAFAEQLQITEDEFELFQRRLGAMQRDGQLMINRKRQLCLPDKLDLIKGRVEGHPDGFGFVVPEEGGDDLYMSPKEMHRVLHGDKVLVRVAGLDRRGRREAKIVEVLEHVNTHVVGRYYLEGGVGFLIPENRRINQDILVPPENAGAAKSGQVVTVEIVSQPGAHNEAVGRVSEILGSFTGPGMEIEIALRKHDLPYVFPPEVEKQAEKLPSTVQKKDLAGREDIRHLPLVTIDGETARDFDDAGDQTRISALGDLNHPALTAAAAIKSGDAHQHTVAMQHAAHFLRAEEDVALVAFLTLPVRLAVTGDDETEPVRVSFDPTCHEVCLVGNDVGIAPVAHQLRLALHRAQAAHEVLTLLGLDVQCLHELVGAHRHAGFFERLHDVLAARQGIVVTGRLAFEERVGASNLAR